MSERRSAGCTLAWYRPVLMLYFKALQQRCMQIHTHLDSWERNQGWSANPQLLPFPDDGNAMQPSPNLECPACDPGFDRACRNLQAAPCQGPDAEGACPLPDFVQCIAACTGELMECRGLPPDFVQCFAVCTGKLMECRGLPPAGQGTAGAEVSAAGESGGAVKS